MESAHFTSIQSVTAVRSRSPKTRHTRERYLHERLAAQTELKTSRDALDLQLVERVWRRHAPAVISIAELCFAIQIVLDHLGFNIPMVLAKLVPLEVGLKIQAAVCELDLLKVANVRESLSRMRLHSDRVVMLHNEMVRSWQSSQDPSYTLVQNRHFVLSPGRQDISHLEAHDSESLHFHDGVERCYHLVLKGDARFEYSELWKFHDSGDARAGYRREIATGTWHVDCKAVLLTGASMITWHDAATEVVAKKKCSKSLLPRVSCTNKRVLIQELLEQWTTFDNGEGVRL